ncbi:tRNA uridine-5-carboxymethylaminomethyl(34) synthesis GTPase MnmE [Flavimaricola marinus]|uniref:tRNA modification GTPase MnmE n=1 Tax=Flavimaricola marinus TaxID=1819565 RepID=A0A238LC83_9RHOB|nr:tRNA uridine-5-carboxymethylaminomethyl(34) synthesis GTPase MnmE [Flavimaricola marinus]SMY07192.1 tRNA modification GTPase MnmE [Flavimaricola marinus]
MDTIFALASAQGRAGVAVIRISGPAAREALVPLVGDLPVAGRSLRKVRGPDGEVVDEALVLSFAKGQSFTGEAVVELQLHGSIAIVDAVLRLLADRPGLRQAEAGEFTRRALENGRLDLAQVEGLADLIDAETEAQRRQAMQVFQGALGDLATIWRQKLIRAAALIEATIDFADEEVPVDVTPEVTELLRDVMTDMKAQSDGVRMAERVRDGFEVAFVGAPNVGKSTLLNRLSGREAAITSEIAGTTRDVIEVRMTLDGLPVTLLDTAGLRDAGDSVEAIGINRGRERAMAADMRIHLVLAGEAPSMPVEPGDLIVVAKSDVNTGAGLTISALTGQGVDELIEAIGVELSGRTAMIGAALRERHRIAMVEARGHLDVATSLLPNAIELADVLAEELRSGIRCVDSLVGRVDVEDILGEIFSSFCIGK